MSQIVTNAPYVHFCAMMILVDRRRMLSFTQMGCGTCWCRSCIGPINEEPIIAIVLFDNVRFPDISMVNRILPRMYLLDVVVRSSQYRDDEVYLECFKYTNNCPKCSKTGIWCTMHSYRFCHDIELFRFLRRAMESIGIWDFSLFQ